MILTPDDVTFFATGLDHPECLCAGPDGTLYAGGEAGQIYRIGSEGSPVEIMAHTGGFILGVAADAAGRIHICDCARREILVAEPDGTISVRSRGIPGRDLTNPNYGLFDSVGNFYFSDSGDYWSKTGTGAIFVIRPTGETELFHNGPFRFANGLALHPSGDWLYVAESTAARVVRIPLSQPHGQIEPVADLPAHRVPDGLAFAQNGELLVSCYRPDEIYHIDTAGRATLWCEDLTAELLMRPTNLLLQPGRLLVANLGGSHLSALPCNLTPRLIHHPMLTA